MEIDHIGYAVSNMQKAITAFTQLGFDGGEVIPDEHRRVNICFMTNGGYKVELVSPTAKGSPVDGFIRKNGNAPYHFCYSTGDIDAEIAGLLAQGHKLVLEPEPAVAFGGRRVAFLLGQSGLVELLES